MSGGIIATGGGVQVFALLSLKGRLKLEMKGLRVSRGPSALSICRQMGFKGSREKVLAQLEAHIEKLGSELKPGEVRRV